MTTLALIVTNPARPYSFAKLIFFFEFPIFTPSFFLQFDQKRVLFAQLANVKTAYLNKEHCRQV